MDLNKLTNELLRKIIAELKEEDFDLGVTIDIKDGCMKVEPRNITTFKDMLALLFHLVGYIKLSEQKIWKKKDKKENNKQFNETILQIVKAGLRVESNESLVLHTALLLKGISKDKHKHG